MLVLNGKKVSEGISFGKVAFYKRESFGVEKIQIQDVDAELKRLEDAKEVAVGEIQVLYEQSIPKIGQHNALVFGVHQMLLEDAEFWDAIKEFISMECVNAEYAVGVIAERVEETLRKQKRAQDMKDVAERLIRILSNKERTVRTTEKPIILVVDDLLPSEAVVLEPKHVLGIVMMEGTPLSHASIFAKTMGIPAVIGIGKLEAEKWEGATAILDGTEGKLYLQPEEEMVKKLQKKQEGEQSIKLQRKAFKKVQTEHSVYANVGSMKEVEQALENGADGIGLVRSEIFCLKEGKFPSEEEQFCIYRKMVQQMSGRRVVVRTWDVGGDKTLEGQAYKEENPALGLRGIRFCLENLDVFRSQLRAILRASAYGKLAILFPMITSLWEVKKSKEILEQVKRELKQEGISFDEEIEVGAMLETPAAVMISGSLAKELDFFSLGTNDLTQYTLAMDRQNGNLHAFYDAEHPAIWEMIRMAARQVHVEGKRISICGELGSDIRFTKVLIELGVDEFSVVSSAIPTVREKLLQIERRLSK